MTVAELHRDRCPRCGSEKWSSIYEDCTECKWTIKSGRGFCQICHSLHLLCDCLLRKMLNE